MSLDIRILRKTLFFILLKSTVFTKCSVLDVRYCFFLSFFFFFFFFFFSPFAVNGIEI